MKGAPFTIQEFGKDIIAKTYRNANKKELNIYLGRNCRDKNGVEFFMDFRAFKVSTTEKCMYVNKFNKMPDENRVEVDLLGEKWINNHLNKYYRMILKSFLGEHSFLS